MPPKSKRGRRARTPKASPKRLRKDTKDLGKRGRKPAKPVGVDKSEATRSRPMTFVSPPSSPQKPDSQSAGRQSSPVLPERIKFGTNNLEEVYGLRGPKYLHKALTTCQDPQEMLHQFRTEEGVLVPTLRPAVALLDLMEATRYSLHIRCAEQLRQELMDKITSAAKDVKTGDNRKRLDELLDKCFSGLNLPLVRPIVLHVLRNLDSVDEKYKKEIMNNKELYEVCGIPLKRLLWIDRRDLFDSEVSPLIDGYVSNRVKSMFDINNANSLYAIAGNVRRQDPSLCKMVDNVGDSTVLYEFTNSLIKKRYLETGSPHYGTLRLDFLIALHEHQQQMIFSTDNLAYKFAFCMDACVRARHVDSKRSKEITGIIDSLKKKDTNILCDLAMMLSDPQIAYFNATSAVRMVQAVINQEGLPRDNSMLLYFLRLLSISVKSKDFVTGKLVKEPKMSSDLVCDFLPKLCSVMVSIAAKKISCENLKLAKVGVDVLLPSLKTEPITVWLILQWVAYLLRERDWDVVMSLIGYFPQFIEQMPLKEDHLIHNMVVQLAHTPQEQRWSVEFADCIFREYFHLKNAGDQGAKHVLRLMYHVHPKLEPSYRDEIMASLETHLDNQEVKELFGTVRARIATSVPVSPFKPDLNSLPGMTPEFTFAPFTPRH